LTAYREPERFNTLHFIFSKGSDFKREREVRAVLFCYDPVAGNNRHYGSTNVPHTRPLKENRLHKWVADGKRRWIDVKSLVTGVAVSPWASRRVHKEVDLWINIKKLNGSMMRSTLSGRTLPTLIQLAKAKTG
jgi:hypothetical protein